MFNRNNQILFLDSSTFDFCFFGSGEPPTPPETQFLYFFRNQGGQHPPRLIFYIESAIERPQMEIIHLFKVLLLDNRVVYGDGQVDID